VLLPTNKVDPRILDKLQLAPIKTQEPPSEPTTAEPVAPEQAYDSIRLIDRILQDNRVSPDLAELRTKAQHETEGTWELRDGLLLRYGKLYVTKGTVILGMLLRTAIIREAHDQPLSSHPSRAKLR
jgi:hypothetical protein